MMDRRSALIALGAFTTPLVAYQVPSPSISSQIPNPITISFGGDNGDVAMKIEVDWKLKTVVIGDGKRSASVKISEIIDALEGGNKLV